MAFPQTIMGKHGWEKVSTTAQKHKVGSRMQIGEREFVYISTGEAAGPGLLMMQPVATGAHDLDLAVSAASAGATTVTLSGSLTITLNQYKDGWLVFNDVGEEGHMYRIKSNTAVSSATGCVLTLDEEDGLATAITSSQQVGLSANPYTSSTIYQHDAIVGAPLGWTCADIASGSYGWICVKGPTVALVTGAITIGLPCVAANDTLDGAVEALDSDDDAEGTIVGYMGNTVGTTGEYGLIIANIQ